MKRMEGVKKKWHEMSDDEKKQAMNDAYNKEKYYVVSGN